MMTQDQLQNHFLSEIRRWFDNRGDQTHRINYALTQESVVIDLGGYEGKWGKTISDMYGCTVHVFEPVPSFCDNIRAMFAASPKVRVYQTALGDKKGEATITMSADGSGMFAEGDEKVPITIDSVHEFLAGIQKVDLIKINIEGAEYDLLDCLTTDELLKLDNIQVQFHTFYPECQQRRDAIRARLSRTHVLTYNYDFVWENWKLK